MAVSEDVPYAPDPLIGYRWPGTTVTWSFATDNLPDEPAQFSSFMPNTNPVYMHLVDDAVALWEGVSGVHLQQVADSATTDIRIGFQDMGTRSGGPIGLTTYRGGNGFFMPGVTVAAEDPTESGGTSATYDGNQVYNGYVSQFLQIVIHEIGHALGLDHNRIDNHAIMWPESDVSNETIDSNDVLTMDSIYGVNPNEQTPTIHDPGPKTYYVGFSSNVHITPFTGIDVADIVGLGETVTITMSGSGAGQLSDPTGAPSTAGNGVFSETGLNIGDEDYAEEALHRIVYTPTVPGVVNVRIQVSDSLGRAVSASEITLDNTNGPPPPPPPPPPPTPASINDPITGPIHLAIGTATPAQPIFSPITVTGDPGGQETVRIVVNGPGTLADQTGAGSFSNGVFTETGTNGATGSFANGLLPRLVFTPPPLAPGLGSETSFKLEVTEAGTTPTDDPRTIVVDAYTAPGISGTVANQRVASGGSDTPFASTVIADGLSSAQLGATITLGPLTDADGTLSGNGLTETASGQYRLAPTDTADLNAELQGIKFTAAQVTGDTTLGMTLLVTDQDGLSNTDTTTSVQIQPPAGPPNNGPPPPPNPPVGNPNPPNNGPNPPVGNPNPPNNGPTPPIDNPPPPIGHPNPPIGNPNPAPGPDMVPIPPDNGMSPTPDSPYEVACQTLAGQLGVGAAEAVFISGEHVGASFQQLGQAAQNGQDTTALRNNLIINLQDLIGNYVKAAPGIATGVHAADGGAAFLPPQIVAALTDNGIAAFKSPAPAADIPFGGAVHRFFVSESAALLALPTVGS